MSKTDLPPDFRYPESSFVEMAEALGLDALSSELRRKIDNAARNYVPMAYFDEDRATRKERRKALEELAAAAANLKRTLDDLATMLIEDLELPSSITRGDLEQLASAAEAAANKVPISGGDPGVARKFLVGDLGVIYRAATGRQPTLRRDRYGKPYGPFFKFVFAALHPLEPHATQGVESDIKKVVAEMGKLDAETRRN